MTFVAKAMSFDVVFVNEVSVNLMYNSVRSDNVVSVNEMFLISVLT